MLPLTTGVQRAEGLGSRECLAIEGVRQLRADDVLYRLADLFVHRRLFSHTTTPSLRPSHPAVHQPSRTSACTHTRAGRAHTGPA